jgi:hypothetical protein
MQDQRHKDSFEDSMVAIVNIEAIIIMVISFFDLYSLCVGL